MLKCSDFNTRPEYAFESVPVNEALSIFMSCSCNKPLALFVCCSLAGFAAGDAAAQGVPPLRVDPVLLGLPPAEKKPPSKPAEPVVKGGATEVKPVDQASVESKPLAIDEAPAANKTAERDEAKPEPLQKPPPSKAAASDKIPARAAAPAAVASPVVASPVPAPVPSQSTTPVAAVPVPRPREQEQAAAQPQPQPQPRAAAPTPVSSGAGSKISSMAPLRVHPGLLGQPVLAASPGGAPNQSASAQAGPARYASAPTVAGLDQARDAAWRAGQPPVLNFSSDVIALPDQGAGAPGLKLAKKLQPIEAGGAPLPMFLTADDLAGVTDHEAVASGNAEARKAGAVVNADQMTYWPVDDELEAIGNVRLAQGDDLVSGPRMRMKMAEQTGVFDEPNFFLKREAKWAAKERERQERGAKGSTIVAGSTNAVLPNDTGISRPVPGSLMNVLGISSEAPEPLPMTEAHGSAERIDFEGENKLRIINGNYTTCKPSDPGWYVRADELALDYDREVGEGKNGTVYFQNTPIFWSPWMSFSLNNARKSGFLAPTAGTSSINGISVMTPYYWNIAPNMDATISPRIFAKRGEQLATEFRYLDHHFRSDVRSEFMLNDRLSDEKNRYAYSVRHQQNLGRGLTGALNLSGVSDDQYFTDLGSRSVVTSQRQLLRQGVLSYGGEWWGATVIGQSYQTLNPDSDSSQRIERPYSLAPQINVNARRPDFYQTDLAFVGQYSSFTHAKWDQGRRTVAYPQISVPIVQPGWYATPKIGVSVTDYSLDRRTTTGPESISRTLPIFSVDSGMTFERPTTWFGAAATQTLEPRLYYLNVPYKDQSDIPVFDSALADFNFAQIFSENQFSGYDRVSDANQLTAALTTRLIDPSSGAEAFRAMFGQRYYFKRQQVTLNGVTTTAGADDKWSKSDFLAAFSGRVLPKTYLDAALQYSPHNSRMDRSSIGARYQPELGKVLNASYRFASKEVSSGALKNVDVAGQWPIWGGWSAVGRYNYSILDHKPVETVAGLEYNAGCWAVRLVGHQVATTTGNTNTSIFVQLELNDFARIGSNPADLLRRNIQGYGLSNQPISDPIFGE